VKRVTYFSRRSYSLDNTAKQDLGEQKIKRWRSMEKMWEEAPDFLLKYNLRDVELCVKLGDKHGVFPFFFALQDLVGLSLEELNHNSLIIDFMLLKMHKDDTAFPNIPFAQRTKYEGAYVIDPPAGRFKNVATFDFKSLYPSIIMSFNISPDTIVEVGDAPINIIGIKFRTDKVGIFPQLIKQLYTERFRLKKEMKKYERGTIEWKALDNKQQAIKTAMNSMYGVTAFPGFRLYESRVAEAITAKGRELIKSTKARAEKRGYQVIYGDTDSCMIVMKSDNSADACKESVELAAQINKELSTDIIAETKIDCSVETAFEKLFSSMIFVGVKKRYCGLLYMRDDKLVAEKDRFHVTGFDIKKKDTPPIATKILKQAFIMLLEFKDLAEIEKWVQEQVKVLELKIDDECCLNMEMARGYDEYDNLPMHVRAARYSEDNLGEKFLPGDRVNMIYVKSVPKGLPFTDVVAYKEDSEILKGFEIDRSMWIEKALFRKLQPTFQALGYDQFTIDGSQTRLGSWA